MDKRYRVVAWAYCRTWTFVIVTGLVLLWLGLPLLLKARPATSSQVTRPDGATGFLMMTVLPIAFASALIANLTKEHLARPQAGVVPGYRRPHVELAILWLLLVMLPFVIRAPTMNVSILGAMAVVCGTAAVFVWAAELVPGVLPVLLMSSWIVSRMKPETPDLIKWMLTGYAWWDLDLVAAAVSVFAIGRWARRLWRLNEEMSEYGSRIPLGADLQKMLDRRMPRTEPSESRGRLDWPRGYVGEGTWERVKLWRATNAADSIWVDLVGRAILLAVMLIAWRSTNDFSSPDGKMALWTVLTVLQVVIPGSRMLQVLDRRLSAEALRPSSKPRMLCELGFGLALEMFYLWAAVAIVSPILAVFLTGTLSVYSVVFATFYSFGATCAAFGFGTWLAHFRSQAIMVLTLLLGALVIAGAAFMFFGPPTTSVWMALSIAMVFVGATFARLAHGAWVETELG